MPGSFVMTAWPQAHLRLAAPRTLALACAVLFACGGCRIATGGPGDVDVPIDEGLGGGRPSRAAGRDARPDKGGPQDAGPCEGGACLDSDATVASPDAEVDAGTPRREERDCAEFHAHAVGLDFDKPLRVPSGETYFCFYFNSPWLDEVQGVAVEGMVDQSQVVHHMLLYGIDAPRIHGHVEACLGVHPDGALIPAFNLDKLPSNVGFEVPHGQGKTFLLELHYINSGDPVEDHSGLRVCATRELREHTATLTWLGTENILSPLGLPPLVESVVSGQCTPGRSGVESDEPIQLLMLTPHMHTLGRRMEVVVTRADGTQDVVLDEPYFYDDPRSYPMRVAIRPGDTVQTHCTFENTTDVYVPFGPTLNHEMCYGLAIAYPARALDHPAPSIVAAQNTCFW